MISGKQVGAVVGVAALGAFGATVQAAPAEADETFGAMAYSQGAGIIGSAWDYPTLQGAKERALHECASRPPAYQPNLATDCWVVAWGPDHCFVFAVSYDTTRHFSAYPGSTIEDAKERTMAGFEGSPVAYFCQDGGEPDGTSTQITREEG